MRAESSPPASPRRIGCPAAVAAARNGRSAPSFGARTRTPPARPSAALSVGARTRRPAALTPGGRTTFPVTVSGVAVGERERTITVTETAAPIAMTPKTASQSQRRRVGGVDAGAGRARAAGALAADASSRTPRRGPPGPSWITSPSARVCLEMRSPATKVPPFERSQSSWPASPRTIIACFDETMVRWDGTTSAAVGSRPIASESPSRSSTSPARSPSSQTSRSPITRAYHRSGGSGDAAGAAGCSALRAAPTKRSPSRPASVTGRNCTRW